MTSVAPLVSRVPKFCPITQKTRPIRAARATVALAKGHHQKQDGQHRAHEQPVVADHTGGVVVQRRHPPGLATGLRVDQIMEMPRRTVDAE